MTNPVVSRGSDSRCPFGAARRRLWGRLESAPGEVGSKSLVKWCGCLARPVTGFWSIYRDGTSDAFFPSLEMGTPSLRNMRSEVPYCFSSCEGPMSHSWWQSWRGSSNFTAPCRSCGQRITCHSALCEMEVSLYLWAATQLPLTCVCASSSPQGNVSEVLLLGWGWGRGMGVLAAVENRKWAGWCLLSKPHLGQAAALFTFLFSLPLIFMFPWSEAVIWGPIWSGVLGNWAQESPHRHRCFCSNTQSSKNLLFINWVNERSLNGCFVSRSLTKQIKRALYSGFLIRTHHRVFYLIS